MKSKSLNVVEPEELGTSGGRKAGMVGGCQESSVNRIHCTSEPIKTKLRSMRTKRRRKVVRARATQFSSVENMTWLSRLGCNAARLEVVHGRSDPNGPR